MHTYNHWITDIEQPTTAKAFTYTIWFPLLGQRYIGYKTVSDKSKWLTYKSSSKPVKELISNGHTAIYRIVKWFDDAADAYKEELSVLTSYDVTNRSEYLNQSIGGVAFNTLGITLSYDHKEKLRAAKQNISDETRAKLSAVSKGRPKSAEHRAKIIAANKGRKHTDETKAKISAAKKGRVTTDETRAKLSAAKQIGLYVTPLGTFNTLKEASIAHNCDLGTIRNRCKSSSNKFKDWSFTPINRDKS